MPHPLAWAHSRAVCNGPSHRLPLPPSPQWLKDPGPRTEKRTLCCDVVCFLFITPLAAISGWLCLRGAQDHLRLHSHLEALGLIALTIALFTIYVLWTLVSGCQPDSRHLGADRSGAWAVAWMELGWGVGRHSACLGLWLAPGVEATPSISWSSRFQAGARSREPSVRLLPQECKVMGSFQLSAGPLRLDCLGFRGKGKGERQRATGKTVGEKAGE